jgi:hypothetical protein
MTIDDRGFGAVIRLHRGGIRDDGVARFLRNLQAAWHLVANNCQLIAINLESQHIPPFQRSFLSAFALLFDPLFQMHMKAVSWDHTPSIVPDGTLFSFSTSNFREVPQSGTKLKSALRRPEQDNPKSSMSLLSNLFPPSVSKEAPPSMKPNLPKKTSRYNHSDITFQSKLGRSRAIAPTLYDDPAFSSDPHANPLFATGHDGRISPPMPGHPTLKKDAHKKPTLPLTIPSIVRDSGEFHLIQPPNSPMSVDNPDTTTSSHDSMRSLRVDKPSKLTKARGSTTAAQSHSVPKSSVPTKSEQSRPLTEKPEKKRNPLGMFWRKSPPTSPTDNLKLQNGDAPPSYETIFSHPSASVAVAPTETQQSIDMASLPPWSSSASADSHLYPGPLHPAVGKSSLHPGPRHPAFAKHRKRKNKLDRIDELDESNPLGIAVHHGGPYEAIQRLVQHSRRKVPHNIGSQYAVSISVSAYISTIADGATRPLLPRKAVLTTWSVVCADICLCAFLSFVL